ncbi:MAG TPA: glycyl-radical enzyme activating protein [Desulfomonilia bacterium]|nr:glycyl-radical enzyme activating protein [Desulfomonilia bacterium]
MTERVLITDIARFSVNDGPGFRTNVFLKGCPLRCAWCHNPETFSAEPQIYWKRRLCVQCGSCLDACPKDAIRPPVAPELSSSTDSSYQKIDRSRCDRCMECVRVCRYEALQVAGKPMSISEILDEVERDRPFYSNSGGGMTVSGGEPTAHPGFCLELLDGARDRAIHTCMDTNGHCDFSILGELTEYADIVLYDLKHVDPFKHYEKTGVRNERILDNLVKLSRIHSDIWIRIPVVPDFNDDLEFHRKAADFIASLGGSIRRVDLLPYHNWCQDKYDWLGIDWVYREVEALEPSFLEVHAELYRGAGISVTIGGSGFEEAGTEHGLLKSARKT